MPHACQRVRLQQAIKLKKEGQEELSPGKRIVRKARKRFSAEKLRGLQALPLRLKIGITLERIAEFYEYYKGAVYVALSGGKDSTVLLVLVRLLYPEVVAVFQDTGLEFPEIRAFVKTFDNVVWRKPEQSFLHVLAIFGYPVISKNVARAMEVLQNPHPGNAATRHLWLTGYNRAGQFSSFYKLANKWRFLVDAPFKISGKCCEIMKKKPAEKFAKESGLHPFIGTMAADSRWRKRLYLETGCNAFDVARPYSTPLGFWTEQDILRFLFEFEIPFAPVYGRIVENSDGQLQTTGERRTGCMFCMFGVHLEKGENRFQRMAHTHPKLYKYCINKLGCGRVLDFIDVSYRTPKTAL